MNAGRHDVEDARGTCRGDSPSLDNIEYHSITAPDRGQATYLLSQKCHRECLVKQPELPVLTLLVVGIPKDATVEERPMYISNHTSDISCGIRRFPGRRILDAVEVVDGRSVEIQRIPLIE